MIKIVLDGLDYTDVIKTGLDGHDQNSFGKLCLELQVVTKISKYVVSI